VHYFFSRAGSIDSIAGPVKSPWTLLFQKIPHQYLYRSSNASSCCHQKLNIPTPSTPQQQQQQQQQKHQQQADCVKQHTQGFHTSASDSSQSNLNSVREDLLSASGAQRLCFEDETDWLVTGGSSGGSAAAVASGTALA
jgi:hypothetical protein